MEFTNIGVTQHVQTLYNGYYLETNSVLASQHHCTQFSVAYLLCSSIACRSFFILSMPNYKGKLSNVAMLVYFHKVKNQRIFLKCYFQFYSSDNVVQDMTFISGKWARLFLAELVSWRHNLTSREQTEPHAGVAVYECLCGELLKPDRFQHQPQRPRCWSIPHCWDRVTKVSKNLSLHQPQKSTYHKQVAIVHI